MCNIATITFSPCIDKSTAIPVLVPEKKLHCTSPRLEPGGGGINVARAINKLGGKALAIFPSGGYTGKYFNHLLEEEGIPAIVIETQNETRENIIVFEESSGQQFRFGMPGTLLSTTEWAGCLQAIEQLDHLDFLVASGSLPPGVPPDIYAQMAGIARQKNAKFIVDTTGEPLQYAADAGAYLLKPNLNELALLAGKKNIRPCEARQAAETVLAKGRIEIIMVSMGGAGAMLVTDQLSVLVTAPAVTMKSTVGAGDSMVAGMVYALSKGHAILEAAQYGVACGTAATLNAGTALCNKADADRLFDAIYADGIYNSR